MDETFMLFLNDIPADCQGFVLELDKYLSGKESGRPLEPRKVGM